MKKFNLFLGGLMAIAFTACTNEELLQEENSNAPSARQVTITAYTPGDDSPSSRVTQGYYEVGHTIPLTWDNGDQISVFFGAFTNTYTKSEKGENTFTGDDFVDGEGYYYAFYPALAEDVENGYVPYDLSNQTGADAYLMCAKSIDRETYQFQHAAAYLKATFPEELKNTAATITLTVPEGVYTKGSIDFLNNFTLRSNNEYKNTIIKTVEFGESTEVWFALPPMTAENKTLNFTIETADKNYSATLAGSAEKAIVAGKYYSATVDFPEAAPELSNPTTFRDCLTEAIYGTSSPTSVGKSVLIIEFEAGSNRTGGVKIGETNAYAVYEESNKTLYVYTKAAEIMFLGDCSYMFSHYISSYTSKLRYSWLPYVETINFNDCVNTSSVTKMSNMFYAPINAYIGSNLSSLDLCGFTFYCDENGYENMFKSCAGSLTVNVSNSNAQDILKGGNTGISNVDNIKVCTTHGAS